MFRMSDKGMKFVFAGIIAVVIIAVVLLARGCSGSGTESRTPPQENKSSLGATTVKIIEVVTTPTAKESITIQNTGSGDVDLSGWSLGDKNDPNARGLDDILKAGKTRKYDRESLGFGINDNGEVIYLKKDGKVIDTWKGN
jgi:hypothetical protein